jgi:hypothetical protein
MEDTAGASHLVLVVPLPSEQIGVTGQEEFVFEKLLIG